MRAKISICPKHDLPRMTSYGRLRCRECKREADARTRKRSEQEKRLYALKIARQKDADAALDARAEKIWREKFAAEEIAYYRAIRVVGARTVWA